LSDNTQRLSGIIHSDGRFLFFSSFARAGIAHPALSI
jgi:hypothetical protein